MLSDNLSVLVQLAFVQFGANSYLGHIADGFGHLANSGHIWGILLLQQQIRNPKGLALTNQICFQKIKPMYQST